MTTITVPPNPNAKPRILYENLMLDGGATITFTTENSPDVHENAYDWDPTTFWTPDDGTQSITAHFPTPVNVDSFGCYSHTLADNGGTIVLRWSDDGSTWHDAFTPVAPADTSPIYQRFDLTAHAWWRVQVVSTPASSIGITAFGQEIALERGIMDGLTPPIVARNTRVTNSVSQNGVFVGRSFVRSNVRSSFSSDYITQQWIRDVWVPFIKAAELHPWFLYWNYSAWPFETCFCYSDDQASMTPAAMTTPAGRGFFNINMPYRGNIS